MTNFAALVPLLAVVAGALCVMLLEAFLERQDKEYLGYVSLTALLVSGGSSVWLWGRDLAYFGGNLVLDRLAVVLCLAFILAGAFLVLMSLKYLARQDMNHGEYYALLLLALSGAMIMASSSSLLVIFLGLETLSVSSYALAGLKRKDPKSSEAAVKYFLMGSFASAFLVFGLALLYGAAGSLQFGGVRYALAGQAGGPGIAAWAGLALVIAGFGFKIALVPFHMWAPDVYEGAPTPVTAFYSIVPKLAGFAVLFRLLAPLWGQGGAKPVIYRLLWAVAVLTIVVGNLAALRQKNLKRLLAYSSIAHSGYILLAVLAGDGASLVFYFVAYLFMNAGAFSALMAMSRQGTEYLNLEDFSGVGFKYPWIGAAFALFLFSLAGFPPTAGFLAKFYVFSAAVRQGEVALVIIAVLASLVSVFYYLRVIVFMYMKDPLAGVDIETDNPALYLVLFLCFYGVLQLGIWPGNLLAIIRQAVASLI
ncbi:MAG: NADH-quinone oxidoreductase subunit N [Candidatus Aminicenantales bacterium]